MSNGIVLNTSYNTERKADIKVRAKLHTMMKDWSRYLTACVFRSTHSTSPVSSQSTVDIEVSKPAVTCGVMDSGFDNPSIDLSSLAHNTTPQSGMLLASLIRRKIVWNLLYPTLLSFSKT